MRKVGSLYVCGRSNDLLKIKVLLWYFFSPSLTCMLQPRQYDTEALAVSVDGGWISLKLYVKIIMTL